MAAKNNTSLEIEAGRWLELQAEVCRAEAAVHRSEDYHAEHVTKVAEAKGIGEARVLSKKAGVYIRKRKSKG